MRITNSPGCSIAGTVSLLPVPGTQPPLLNLCTFPPVPNRSILFRPSVLPRAELKPPSPPFLNAPPKKAAPLTANKAVTSGITGAIAFPTAVIALAKDIATPTMAWKLELSAISRNSSLTSSVSLAI